MAAYLPSEERNYFSPGPIRRSQTDPSYAQLSYSVASAKQAYNHILPPTSAPTSQPSPRSLGVDTSYTSAPLSGLSFGGSGFEEEDEDQILFPSYDDAGYYGQDEDLEPPTSPRTGDSYSVSPTNSTPTEECQSDLPELVEHAEDDTAVRNEPTRHVDYLSHNWKEEDIWSSWKHIVSRRKTYPNSERLENASWRTWTKAKNQLKTISPETLNWLKDCDVTWLYGPLQTGSDKSLSMQSTSTSPSNSCRVSKSGSFSHCKKPILKKRSMSEIMLQRSLSSSSLLKQAAAAVQAQQSDAGRGLANKGAMPTPSDFVTLPLAVRQLSRANSSVAPSLSSSGIPSPPAFETKHIHFDEQVKQCIALDTARHDDDDDEGFVPVVAAAAGLGCDSEDDDDDDAVTMKSCGRKLPAVGGSAKKSRSSSSRKKGASACEGKTIAMLPSTTLKYREDSPEPKATAMKHSDGGWSSEASSRTAASYAQASSSSSGNSFPANGILIGNNDEDEDDDGDYDAMEWEPTPSRFAGRRDSVAVTQDRMQGMQQQHRALPDNNSNNSNAAAGGGGEPAAGMRRTASGMFMPYDEDDEDDAVSEGLFGAVVDTVNTAKDIAHVIWNVGWRR